MIEELCYLMHKSQSVSINWIPGHRDIGLNPEADKMAEIGHKSLNTYKMPFTRNWIKKTLKPMINAEFQVYLRNTIRPSQLCEDYPSRKLFYIPRTKLSSSRRYGGEGLFHIQTGHTYLKTHQILVNSKVKDKKCTWCNQEEETLKHVQIDCNGFPTPA